MQHCCVALGSRDRSVSIWSTALKRPLVVITDLFTNSVEDVCWSTCGTLMMACSLDGSVAVAQFSWKEIGQPLSPEEQVKPACDINNYIIFISFFNSHVFYK